MPYQTTDGYWIAFDGVAKRRFDTFKEAVMSERPTAAQEWEAALRAIIGQARELITAAQGVSLLAQTNGIAEIIADTPAGELLPGTTITREDAALRAAAFADMIAWLGEDASGAPEGVTRLAVIFRRF
jgi:hypothetical protein